ncbi:MAG: IS200/IS605 family transposase [Bacteroidota bacterium]
MPFIKIWIHAVWSTKNREPLLDKVIRKAVIDHIQFNAKDKNIYIDTMNGYVDHLHALISLKGDQTPAKVMQLIKGESAYWINQERLIGTKFAWQSEYFAISVSESQLPIVRKYIDNQEEHHSKKSFQQEYEEFMEKYRFDKFSG